MKHRDSRFTDCYKPNPELEAWPEQQRQRDIAALDVTRVRLLWNEHLAAIDSRKEGEVIGRVHAYGVQLGRDRYPTHVPRLLALLVLRRDPR
jgi:hypothetical protein